MRARLSGAFDDEPAQCPVERVFWVRAEESLVAIAAADDQIGRLKFSQLILHGMRREETQPCQLTSIQFLAGIHEQQPQNLCSHKGE